MDEGGRKLHQPPKPKKEPALTAAALALIELFSGQPAQAADVTKKKTPEVIVSTPRRLPDARIHSENSLTKREMSISEYEQAVERNDIPLGQQVEFISRMLQPGALYFDAIKHFFGSDAASEALKNIDIVSTRMTRAYEEQKMHNGLEHLANIDLIKETAASFRAETKDGRASWCNGSYILYQGELVFETAAHCIASPDGQFQDINAKYYSVNHETDTALMLANHETRLDHDRVPDFHHRITNTTVIGKPVVAFSYDQKTGRQKTFFSFALPPPIEVIASDNFMTMILPPEEGKPFGPITRTIDAVTGKEVKHYNLGGSGSSGGRVGAFIDGENAAVPAGTIVAVREIVDGCRRVCIALGVFSAPDARRAHFDAARKEWLEKEFEIDPHKGAVDEKGRSVLEVTINRNDMR